MKILGEVTNVRPTKEYGDVLIAKTTASIIFVSPEAAAKMEMGKGDRLIFVEGIPEEGADPILYIGKGSKGGAKLGTHGKSAKKGLVCSSASAYQMLQGEKGFDVTYDILGLDEDNAEFASAQEFNGETVTFYPLSFKEKVESNSREEKAKGKKKSKKEDKGEEAEDADLPSFEDENAVSV